MCEKDSTRKGMLLVAGKATRLYPLTEVVPKAMLPVYDKPMIYYPLSILIQAHVRDIMILVSPSNKDIFMKELGNGSRFGLKLTYVVQEQVKGIADAFLVGEKFIGDSDVMMVLGDNIICSPNSEHMRQTWEKADQRKDVATIFGYNVYNPKAFGVVEIDKKTGDAISLEEKPEVPKSTMAVPGIYFYPNDVIKKAKQIKPSARGELEITSVNKLYMQEHRLKVDKLKMVKWFDTGTFETLFETNNYLREQIIKTSKLIGCPEMEAYKNGWISKKHILEIAKKYKKTSYGKRLKYCLE